MTTTNRPTRNAFYIKSVLRYLFMFYCHSFIHSFIRSYICFPFFLDFLSLFFRCHLFFRYLFALHFCLIISLHWGCCCAVIFSFYFFFTLLTQSATHFYSERIVMLFPASRLNPPETRHRMALWYDIEDTIISDSIWKMALSIREDQI